VARVKAGSVELEYESLGPANAETILLIMGVGAPLTRWRADLCQLLVESGYRVIRFDNRDCGLSTLIDAPAPDPQAIVGGGVEAPYSLWDMADDTVYLMDALGIERAHIVGASMGGMVAQIVAAQHPGRAASLTSIMSTTGNPELSPPRADVLDFLLLPAPAPDEDLTAFVEHRVKAAQLIGSPGSPTAVQELREQIRFETERRYTPEGVARQMAAVWTAGDRRDLLRTIKRPTIVLHGADDPLIPADAGRDTAANIVGAELRIISGMGHDIAPGLIGEFAHSILRAAARTE
jgi:pimeloyl-ACP methyl ester carboxylesterase